jgi:thymidylate synthase
MFAQVTGMVARNFIHTYGDLHIYTNHAAQVREQLSRTPYSLPKLWLNPAIREIDDFTFEDIQITNYHSHEAISAPIAV